MHLLPPALTLGLLLSSANAETVWTTGLTSCAKYTWCRCHDATTRAQDDEISSKAWTLIDGTRGHTCGWDPDKGACRKPKGDSDAFVKIDNCGWEKACRVAGNDDTRYYQQCW
ncbi:hypothetical protein Tdes44962_MAKER04321 [Teratosphaeria destructans]|uniref:Secreted protein n=1 Tax=Teratosphaeria destructans TaxID=418781 RepID=A0A9W7SMI3_9PEZI|nr:hypothetical protein Tdes44962_MAKER04321 [Teratosphaeria destructans]